ncbi:MAG: YcaO-like family protein [Actinomycetota bacterium]
MSATSTSERSRAAPRRLRGEVLAGKKYYFDGTHRTCEPAATIERFRPAMEPFGITRLADVTGLDRLPISTIIAIRPNATTLASGSGKGTSKAAATASALMEALEIAHAERATLDSVYESHRVLSQDALVVAIDELPLVPDALFNPDLPEHWVRGWDIVHDREMFLPRASTDFTVKPVSAGHSSFRVDSNGLASGNTIAEAVLSGLYECIERDATTCWQHAIRRTGYAPRLVDASSVDDAGVNGLLEALQRARLELYVFDLTTDTSVPTYGALMHSGDGAPATRMKGFGTHLDPAVAMSRAITEAVQARAVYVAGTRDDVFDHRRRLIKVVAPPIAAAAVDLLPAESRPDDSSSEDFGEDLHIVIDRLAAAGLNRVIVVDLRNPASNVPVVRVFVPGLEGDQGDHYVPGRRARLHAAFGSVAPLLAEV